MAGDSEERLSLAAEDAADRGWLCPVGEKRLRARLSAARR